MACSSPSQAYFLSIGTLLYLSGSPAPPVTAPVVRLAASCGGSREPPLSGHLGGDFEGAANVSFVFGVQISGRFSLQCKEKRAQSESGASKEMKEEREREKKQYLFFMLPWDFVESHKAFFGYFTLKKRELTRGL